jgi:hypothetical protein
MIMTTGESTLSRNKMGFPGLDVETWDTTETERPILVGNPGVGPKHREASA